MDEATVKQIELVTASKNKALAFDIEIVTDKLKYSSWWTGIASAGAAATLITFQKATSNLLPPHPRIWLICISIPLVGSLFIGAYLNSSVNRMISRFRQSMTLILKQQIILLADNKVSDTGRKLVDNLFRLKYLDLDDKQKYEDIQKAVETSARIDRLLFWQQIGAGLGYALAISVALLNIR